MKVSPILAIIMALICLSLPACQMHDEQPHQERHKIVVTSPQVTYVTMKQPYVCQIHSQKHIDVCAFQSGYLEEIAVKEGQAVNKDEVMFRIVPTLFKARYAAELAEVSLAQQEYNNAYGLFEKGIVSDKQLLLLQAKLEKAKAKAELAKAELKFTEVIAPFSGIVDRLHEQLGSMIKEGKVLTTLSDNSVMWVYFNVPEASYFEFKALEAKALESKGPGSMELESRGSQGKEKNKSHLLELVDSRIELKLADGHMFNCTAGNIVTVEGQFDNTTGNIPFRADFPNPNRLLRHGQTGTVIIYRTLRNAVVIPQRAVSELLNKQFVYVIDENGEAHQRRIVVQHELDDIFVIEKGLDVNDKFVIEGIQFVRDGTKVEEYEYRKPEEALANQKNRAE